ncbi:MAG: hypothetical protein ABUS56_00045 [Acidobacteriota bacterium]
MTSMYARIALAVALAFAIGPATGAAAPQASTPRTADGHPNLAGIWKARRTGAADSLVRHAARAGVPAGAGAVAGQALPYQPWAAAKKAENFRHRRTADPLAQCFLPGVPRIMYLDHAFQIFQTPDLIAVAFEWSNIYRTIHMNGSPHPADIEFWMGDSRGRWDGDTLVVDVRNHNDRTWLDASGNFHSDAFAVVERYTLTGPDTMAYEATVEDTKVFTAPWVIRLVLQRQTGVDRLGDHECLAEAEEANGLFEPEPGTWYPKSGVPPGAPRFSAEVERIAALPKAPLPSPGPKAGPVRRLPDGTPDFHGYYASGADNVLGNYGLEAHGEGLGKGRRASRGLIIDPPDGRLPTRPWARALQEDRLRPERAYDDPAAHCFPIGSPRGMYLNEIFVLQPPGYVVFLFERMGFRIVALDGRRHPPERVRRWQGDSVGRWENGTLVIDTTNFTGKTWLNEPAGEHGGEVLTYGEHLIERLTPIDAETVHYEATVLDPIAYTRPWTIALSMKQAPLELLEVACKEDDQDLPHLKALKDAARAGGRKQPPAPARK